MLVVPPQLTLGGISSMRNLFVLMSFLLFLVACDDNASSNQVPFQPPRDMGPGGDAGTPNIVGYPYKLVIDGPNEVSLTYNQEKELRVRYLNDGDQEGEAGDEPISGGTIELRFEPEDQNLAQVQSRALRTDTNGIALFNLTANTFTGRFRVVAEAPNARPVAWTIRIGKDPLGDVNVAVVYDEEAGRYTPQGFSQVDVQLIEGDCSNAFVASNDERYSFIGQPITPFTGIDCRDVPAGDDCDESAFSDIPGGVTFAAVAVAQNEDGRNVARGCTEGAVSNGGQVIETIVTLQDEPLEFKGTFKVDHEFDINEMLRGTEDSGLEGFVDVIEILGAIGGCYTSGEEEPCDQSNPSRGDSILQLLCDRANVGDAICGVGRLFLAPPLDDAINDNIDEETLRALDSLGDLYANLARFNVYGEMEFSANYPNEEGYLRGNETRWSGIRFVWRDGCPPGADCERSVPFVDEDQGRESPVIADFDALYEAASDTLYISRHRMALSYGRIVVIALERWILPAVLPEADVGPNGPMDGDGVVSIAEFLGVLVDCTALTGGDPNLTPLCTTAIELGAGFIRDAIFEIDDSTDLLTLEGSVKVADDVVDLRADRLYEGVWNGTFGVNGDLTSNIGTFEGCRAEDCEAIAQAGACNMKMVGDACTYEFDSADVTGTCELDRGLLSCVDSNMMAMP